MAVSNVSFELITGAEVAGAIGASSFSRAFPRVKTFVQPDWYDVAGIDNRVQKIGFKVGTGLAASGTVTIDLTALDSPDGTTGTISLTKLVACYIQITSATGQLTIGNASPNGHPLDFGAKSHTRTILPGGPGHAVGDPSGTGYAVDSSNKNVLLTNSHGSQAVDYVAYFAGE